MITLERVSEKTFIPVLRMKLPPEQERFVASNAVSLAQAWLYYDQAKPFAVLKDGEAVGFLMLDWDENERTCGIWRLMIAPEHQKKGCGRAAMEKALKLIRESGRFDLVHLSFVPGNEAAKRLYASLGFVETGETDEDEIVMVLPLTDRPGIGFRPAEEDDLAELWELIESEREKNTALPPFFSEDALIAAVLNGEVLRLTLMGKTVGLFWRGALLLADEHRSRLPEAQEAVRRYRAQKTTS